jgi:hypothetical protein
MFLWLNPSPSDSPRGELVRITGTFALADGHSLRLVPFCGTDSGQVEVLGVLQLNVCAKRFVEHFTGLSLGTRSVGHGLFDADDLMALRTLAEAMTGAIHFALWSKPTNVGQFWFFHALSFPQDGRFGYPVDIQTGPLPSEGVRQGLFLFRGKILC